MDKISEEFLHFIWKAQHFNKENLKTTSQKEISILKIGEYNPNAGPDFLHAKIKIGEIEWHGHIEIHLRSSNWNQHNHQSDEKYNSVILHVVYEDDKPCYRKDGTQLSTLELKNRIYPSTLEQYKQLLSYSMHSVACSSFLPTIKPIIRNLFLERTLIQRLEKKSMSVLVLLKQNQGNWEETSYQLLAKGFGSKINQESFLDISKRIPFSILKKHADNLTQTEALLFGVAGFLSTDKENLSQSILQKEYYFLRKKYRIEKKELSISNWKFSKLRPANFPTIRIAQLAAILCQFPQLFSTLISINDPKKAIQVLKIEPSHFWLHHFTFNESSSKDTHALGDDMIYHIILNVIVPLLAAYSNYTNEYIYMDQAINLLEKTRSEKNHIVAIYSKLDFPIRNAADSQAVIELYQSFCSQKQCLTCGIGNEILKR